MSVFTLPDLGEGLHDAEIVAWHVAVGDHVVADQPLVSVETAKAVVEVPSPQAGRIARLCAAAGERVPVGAPLVEFEGGPRPDTGALVGELAGAAPEPHARPVIADAEQRSAAGPAPPGAAPTALPAARALAARHGIDLATLRGTGPRGAITIVDVERAAAAAAPTFAGAEPLSGVRRAMAVAMARSGAEVVPASVCDDADIGDWVPGTDVTARLVRALVVACAAAPALNAWYDGRAVARRLHARVDLGIAVDTADGLIVPVLRDPGRHSPDALRLEIERLKADVRARRTPLAELRGATITLSNFGMLAGRYAAMAIVPPQVAILGAGHARAVVMPHDGGIIERCVLPLSLTFDHRAVTGGEAARFLATAIADLGRRD